MQTLIEQTIGVAGCGSMGLPMAMCLRRAGFDVYGYDVRPLVELSAALDGGKELDFMMADPIEFAAKVDVVISVVRDTQQTEALLFDEQALFTRAGMPRVLIVSSTLSPRYVAELERRLPANVRLMDAPMSGAPYRAQSGSLSFMLGGDRDLVVQMMPLFEAMGHDIYHLGPLGHGMTVKVLNNYCAAASVVATRRVLNFADALDFDRNKLLAVMRTSSGSNWFADNLDSIDWSAERYADDNTIGIVHKDVLAALDTLRECDAEAVAANRDFDAAILEALRRL